MELSSSERGADIIVKVEEERIDAAIAVAFKDAMRTYFAGTNPRVILDLSHVEFVDSSGLGAIVAILKEVADDQSLALAGMTSGVEKVFRLTRMDTIFTIFADVDAAFDGIKNAS